MKLLNAKTIGQDSDVNRMRIQRLFRYRT